MTPAAIVCSVFTAISTFMYYELKLVYDPEPKTQTLKETVTYCACLELYTVYGIECYQTSATRIAFERDRDRMLAIVHLSSSTSFRVVCTEECA